MTSPQALYQVSRLHTFRMHACTHRCTEASIDGQPKSIMSCTILTVVEAQKLSCTSRWPVKVSFQSAACLS